MQPTATRCAEARSPRGSATILVGGLVSRKPLTAHVLRAPGGGPGIAIDDAAIAAALQPGHLASKPFAPLPVLGVPGWWALNEDAAFYADTAVFRPPRPPHC